jgi:hypothetical protein
MQQHAATPRLLPRRTGDESTPAISDLCWIGIFGPRQGRGHPAFMWSSGLGFGALGILLVALTSPINLGVRHVLVIYPLVALAAAFGVVRWAERSRIARTMLGVGAACVALEVILLLMAVPNQITYFNVLGGSHPAYISSDSDFDWGQDIARHRTAVLTFTSPSGITRELRPAAAQPEDRGRSGRAVRSLFVHSPQGLGIGR